MSALQIYERGAVFADGQLLVECQTITVNLDPKLNPINTMQKGFAGVSPGSEESNIDISEAIPRAGFDFAAISKMRGVEIVELVIFAGAKKLKFKGFITKVSLNFGADRASENSFSLLAAPVEESDL